MPKRTDKERVQEWETRALSNSKNEYEPWEQEYSCDMLEEYFLGKQWQEQSAEWNQRKYVINMFYPSIKISQPSLLYSLPSYRVTPRPSRMDDPLSDVEVRAKLQEDTLQTTVEKPSFGFDVETGMGILDAYSRFAVVQIGYSADYIDNPNAGRPVLQNDKELLDANGDPVLEGNFKLKSETPYIQWIPAKSFRVGGTSKRFEANDWCGYYKWLDVADVQRNPRYKNTSNLKATARLKDQGKDEAKKSPEEQNMTGKVKVWFIWDMREKQRKVFMQGGDKFFLEEPYKTLPFAVMKFDEETAHPTRWLPLPHTYNWIHPQNELNDTRDMQRIHRKRAKRRYRRHPGVTSEEFNKLEDGEDMVCIETANENDITPIPDAPLDPQISVNVPMSHEDFTRISGISGESQQVAQSETATQANLIAVMGQTREASKRLTVAKWLSDIGRILLQTMREKMKLPFWIQIAVDPASPLAAQEALDVAKTWKEIVAEELGDIDNDISVELTSLSPIAREQERNNWMQFLTILTSPAVGMILSNSPRLLRKTAQLFDIRNERDLREVSRALQVSAMAMAQAEAQKAGVAMPGQPAPGPTPSNAGIAQQLTAQLPQELLQ